MASRKFFHAKPNYIYPTSETDDPVASDRLFEFDEADLWNSNEVTPFESGKTVSGPRPSSRKVAKKIEIGRRGPVASASMPVNIPDWSKILKDEYQEHRKGESDDGLSDDNDDGDHDGRVPPHEYLARRRGASFSVHEGIGRTLKGRDLRSVRNAIWKRVGFED